jgi:hypothetical protein
VHYSALQIKKILGLRIFEFLRLKKNERKIFLNFEEHFWNAATRLLVANDNRILTLSQSLLLEKNNFLKFCFEVLWPITVFVSGQ